MGMDTILIFMYNYSPRKVTILLMVTIKLTYFNYPGKYRNKIILNNLSKKKEYTYAPKCQYPKKF